MKLVDPNKVFPKDEDKTYGLMELVKGSSPNVGRDDEGYVFTWPHVLYREIALFALVAGLLLIFSFLRLWAAYHLYLRFRHSFATALASQMLVFMIVINLLMLSTRY